jgi:hypothetical protein
MVSVKVREEDVLETERDTVAHHLTLSTLAAIEEQSLAFADDGDGRDVALDRWTRSRGAE